MTREISTNYIIIADLVDSFTSFRYIYIYICRLLARHRRNKILGFFSLITKETAVFSYEH